jgi:hypothetical protein
MRFSKLFWFTLAMLLSGSIAKAQATEVYAGHQRAGVDILWFKYFKNNGDEKTPFLFFSRNRAGVDYTNSPTAFGSTNAVSYNFKNGLGIVAAGTFLNTSFKPKLGIQYFHQQGNFMLFTWLVADLEREGNLDLFGLFRYQPSLSEHWKVFSQLELFPVYKPSTGALNLTQRLRLGLKTGRWRQV